MKEPEPTTPPNLPQARVQPVRGFPWFMLIPLAALVFALWLGYRSLAMRGIPITISLEEGHGLQVGDDVRYRGATVGEVVGVDVTPAGLTIRAVLSAGASELAAGGARVWVVRPQVGLTGVAGLETVVGPRYLAILPGDGPPQRHFVGLERPPIVEGVEPGDLEIVLSGPQRGGLRPGAPVLYRQVQIGTVLSVGLTSDGSAVEARVHIEKPFIELIRPETKFWTVSGFSADVKISGVNVSVPSLEALLAGGVALATPPGSSPRVRNGHRFELADKAEDGWLGWQPLVAIGSSLLPPGVQTPSPVRAVLEWGKGRWLSADRMRRAWVLPTESGLLAPANLFTLDDKDMADAQLEIGGQTVSLTASRIWHSPDLVMVDVNLAGQRPWPSARIRRPSVPEDVLVIGDPAGSPIPLSASRLSPLAAVPPASGFENAKAAEAWAVDPAVPVDESWHGAAVLSRQEGMVLGLLLVADKGTKIALWP
jgi:hypothetical protein